MDTRRIVALVGVALLLGTLGVVVVGRRGGGPAEPGEAPAPAKVEVIPGTEAANAAKVAGDPGPRALGLPPLDTAAEAAEDPCTLLALSREKIHVSQAMLADLPADDTVGARRLRATITRQERAGRRHAARAGKRGLACAGE